jgi:hypothetical protein
MDHHVQVTAQFTRDASPPVTTITEKPPADINSTNATFQFIANKPNCTFTCSLDGAAFASCSSPVNYSNLGNGTRTFQVRATDQSGNVENPPVSYSWNIETVQPDTIITSGPPAFSNKPTYSITFVATTNNATFACTLDNSAPFQCSSPFTYSSLAEGAHSFTVQATSQFGLQDPMPATVTWAIDTTLPRSSFTTTPPATASTGSGTFIFSSNEPVTAYACQLDSTAYPSCSSPFSFSGLADGTHSFSVWATDRSGNSENPPTNYTWTVNSALVYVKVSVSGQPDTFFNFISTAINNLASGAASTIRTQAVSFTENIDLNRCEDVSLSGGFNEVFSNLIGTTTVNGSLTISCGTLTIENIAIL